MLVVAERINSSRKSIYQAIEEKNEAFIQQEAIDQTKAGAHYIDVNAGLFLSREADSLAWLIDTVQAVTTLPLCIDSANPQVIRQVLPLVEATPLINSITLEKKRYHAILPLLLERPTRVIALCQGDGSAAHSDTEKVDMAEELIARLSAAGVSRETIHIDPLVFPLATDSGSATATLAAMKTIKDRFPDVHLICGLTNVSFGLPHRKLINRSFLTIAMAMGLDSAIIDPTDTRLMAALKAGMLINNKDPFSQKYLEAFRNGLLESA